MRMQDKAKWDSQKKSVGDGSDQDEKQPQDKREAVQRRTFTRWMNAFLQRRDPPVEVRDLFTDIQDGRILMALLEELSGCKLLYRFRPSSHRIFRLNNISKALAFLDDRHVKLLGIDASGIADGIPSVVLHLVWNIILFFQVKEVTAGLQRHLSSSLSSLSMSSYPSFSDLAPQPSDIGSYYCKTLPSKGRKTAREPKYHGKAIKTLLQWVQTCTSKFGVEVRDFGKSWRSGLAFLAMIKSFNPAFVDLRESLSREPRENIQLAFMIAHHSLDIPPLLEPEDVLCTSPDEQSVITYVSMFLGRCSGIHEYRTTNIEVPDTPNFGSLESVSFGETLADNQEAQALLKGLEKSSEQQLWKRWGRIPPGSPWSTLLHTNGAVAPGLSSSTGDIFLSCHSQSITEQPAGSAATSPTNKKKNRCPSVFQPPRMLDAGVDSQEIRPWMEKVSADQGYSKPIVEESTFSLSSEEGIYSLSSLDSDEEEAYSYILDLNKEVFQPYDLLKRQVSRVEEETVEEMFPNGQQTEEPPHLDRCETLNSSGYKHQEGSLAQNVESEIRTFDWDNNESSLRKMTNNRAVFDMETEKERISREEGEERGVRAHCNCDGDNCEEEKKEKTENARLVTHGYNKTEALVDEAKKTKLFEVASWKKEDEEVSGMRVADKTEEEENVTTVEEGQGRKLGGKNEETDCVKEERRRNQPYVVNSSFKVGVNDKILIAKAVCKVRGAGATRISTEVDNDSKDNDARMEDLTWEDEDKKEYSDEVMNSMDFEAVITAEEKDREVKIKRRKLTDKKATTKENPGKTTPQNGANGDVNIHGGGNSWTAASSATSQSFREGGFILQSLAASRDITPLELELLLVLWILLYCCLILPQIYL
ncbi:EH domain-binding protein 1 isoform X1 [Micropterus salmoides]|uniref:EH domain-binding protein 1 isoform X1 n=2 Tax=Micropterus salmoides TaxID=27706 RepID=UPI0018EADB8B|nr:EH domain-binding protein 1 isoform X1 [Micropterus salmoides]